MEFTRSSIFPTVSPSLDLKRGGAPDPDEELLMAIGSEETL
jgi:hypothetical protein